jgi:hypothetical protein
MKSSLAKHQLYKPLTEDELFPLEKKLYLEKDKVIIKVEEIKDPYYRQEVRNEADKKFNVKKGKA